VLNICSSVAFFLIQVDLPAPGAPISTVIMLPIICAIESGALK
jgi:hypothetical protein